MSVGFLELFISSRDVVGRVYPTTGKIITEIVAYGFTDVEKHVNGEIGIGLCPINTENNCHWGAIDVDDHTEKGIVDAAQIVRKIEEKGLPLTLCQSRRKGAHLYLFLKEPASAKLVREALKSYVNILELSKITKDIEIFPKQETVPPGGIGNWLNMPYFGDTRKSVDKDGNYLTLDEFIALAKSRRVSLAPSKKDVSVGSLANIDTSTAPPCIERMLRQGVHEGSRNEALYNFTVFAKKVDDANSLQLAMDFNANCMANPLPYNEAKSTIRSASRRDYLYKCATEPCKSLCNSAVCVTRKYGIVPGQVGRDADGTEMFTGLKKIMTEPVKWELTVQGVQVYVTTDVLMDFRKLRLHIVETLTKVIPPLKNDTWDELLRPLMENAQIIDAPIEATQSGALAARLEEYISDAYPADTQEKAVASLGSGYPVHIKVDGQMVTGFKGIDFVEWLKRRRCDDLKGSDLWLVLRGIGVKHGCVINGNGDIIDLWYVEKLIHVKKYKKEVIHDEF